MEQQKRVGIWIRVSTEDQAKGESPEHHEQRGRLYAASKGWDVVTVYHLEALTGKSVMGYAETKRMLEDIKGGFITGLIFSKLARFARNTKELLEFADIFQQEKADLISLQEAIDTSTPAGRLFYTMIAAIAQWEREEIVSRIVASIPIRAKLGKHIGGQASLGYKWIGGKGETKKLVIDEEFAPVRKLIYELFLKHKRKKAVARVLNEAGHRTKDGNLFTDTTINRLLRDSMAKGVRKSNFTDSMGGKRNFTIKDPKDWVFTECPAIISPEIWDECNQLLDQVEKKRQKLGPQTKTLLAGYVQCEPCKRKMYVYHHTKTPKYICPKCKTRIHIEDLEYIYKGELKEFLLTDTSISEYLQSIDRRLQEKANLLDSLRDEREKIKKRTEEMVTMRVNREWSKEMFVEHFKPLEERIMQIDKEMPELEADIDFMKIQHHSSDVVLSDAKDLYANWDTMEFDNKRTLVEFITDSITVGKTEVGIKLSYLPTKNPTAAFPASDITNSLNPVKGQREVISGLPFSTLEKSVPRRRKPQIKEPTTIGEHIKKTRTERNLTAETTAEQMGVNVHTLALWERGKNYPGVGYLKKIIAFLGYYPFPEPVTLGEKMRKYRQMHGLHLDELAKLLCVAPEIVGKWESAAALPDEKKQRKIEKLMQQKELSK